MISEGKKKSIAIFLISGFLFYSFFLYSYLPNRTNGQDKIADQGKMVWQKYNCNACHQIYGLGGYLGPDLTNISSLKSKEYICAFLKNGSKIMPKFNLSDSEINQLLAFLNQIDKTGISDPRTFKIQKNGTIKQ